MTYVSGLLLSAILAALSALHVYWASGGKWGSSVTVPTKAGKRPFNPGPVSTLAVAAALLAAMFTILGRLGILGDMLPQWLFHLGSWAICVVFLARAVGDLNLIGFFKTTRGTPFARWDTWVYSPLCLLISAMAFVVARKGPL